MTMRRFLRPWFYCLLVFGLLSISVVIYKIGILLTKPMFVASTLASDPMIIEIKPHSSASSLIDTLYSRHLIPSKRFYLYLIRLQGIALQLKAGIYQVLPGESIQHLLHRIVAGDVLLQSFRIIEGSNLHQVSLNLLQAPFLTKNSTTHLSKDWSLLAGSHLSAEGLLLADTYQYPAGSNAKNLLKMANKKLLLFLEDTWQKRSLNLPYKTSYEMLIVASILEKETAQPEERRIISGIVMNRLQKRMPLQMDPTVVYALGVNYLGKLTHGDLAIDSPYNTYRYKGLPPTPIALVGKDAIEAAAHPKHTNYLYFVARRDGTHIFSETYSAQKKAISHINQGF